MSATIQPFYNLRRLELDSTRRLARGFLAIIRLNVANEGPLEEEIISPNTVRPKPNSNLR